MVFLPDIHGYNFKIVLVLCAIHDSISEKNFDPLFTIHHIAKKVLRKSYYFNMILQGSYIPPKKLLFRAVCIDIRDFDD